MRKLLCKLWEDDGGFIVSLELLFIAVILVIGIIAGMGNLRVAMISAYTSLANAVLALNPSYAIDNVQGDSAGGDGTMVTWGPQTYFTGGVSGPQTLFVPVTAASTVVANNGTLYFNLELVP